jgi:hypothetical protein
MSNRVKRTETNMARIRAIRATPAATEIRLQLSDDDLRAISYNPRKCNPCGIWREGRQFHLFTHAKAEWAGGGWWDIKAPSRKALDQTLARLVGVWNPVPVQQSLPLPKPEPEPASRETGARHHCRPYTQ